MRTPEIVEVTTTCPECGWAGALEVIVLPFQRVRGSKDQIYKTTTWAACPGCAHEWKLSVSTARHEVVAA